MENKDTLWWKRRDILDGICNEIMYYPDFNIYVEFSTKNFIMLEDEM